MSKMFPTINSGNLRLGRKIGAGGEGEVYEVEHRHDLVAKLYHERPSPEKAEKLIVLSEIGTERLRNVAAWPVDVLLDKPEGNVVGFVMNRINRAEEVHTLHSPKSRLQKFPEASWSFLIYVAANIARAVAVIHDHGLVIGDLNPKNILVTKKATVYLLDCDSFQVMANGKTYRCEAGFPEYTPPELQGLAFKEIDRRPEHDYFGLAVVIFQLLFIGRHPFSGRFLGQGEMPLERAIRELRFAYGDDAEVSQMQPPPGALALDAFPRSIVGVFRRAFLTITATVRPKPREWVEPLEVLAKSLKKCDLHSGHFFYQELSDCPWCEIESCARVRLFNFMLPGADGTRSQFRLDEMWRKIESIRPPAAARKPQRKPAKGPVASPEAASFANDRLTRFLLALAFSAVAGFVISWFADSIIAGWLLILVGVTVSCYAKAVRKDANLVRSIFHGRPFVSDDPFVQKVRASRQQADDAVRQIEEQWEKEAGNGHFLTRLNELRAQRDTYANLSQIRKAKLKNIEAEARKAQLDEYLGRFEIKDAEISGVWSTTNAALHISGIETAADVTKQNLKHVPNASKYLLIKLFEWRRSLEEGFVFDPSRGAFPQARISMEKEMDAIRFRLEHELSSGPFYLHRMKQEIEGKRKQLKPALTIARQSLAHAEKDLAVVAKRNPFWPIVVVLIIAFCFGANLEPKEKSSEAQEIEQSAGVPEDEVQTANDLYDKGLGLSKEGKDKEAADFFRKAIDAYPLLISAHERLSYSLYRLHRYDESIEAAQEAIRIKEDFTPYFYLGLNYVALKNWGEAKTAFDSALSYREPSSCDEKYLDAYYNRALALSGLGKAGARIEKLERDLERVPGLTVERFELATLYLWVGNFGAAEAQHQLLKGEDDDLAEALSTLILRHNTPPPLSPPLGLPPIKASKLIYRYDLHSSIP